MKLRIAGVTFAVAALAMNCHPGFAADREEILEALGKCAAIADDKVRLACYDALSPHVKEVLASPPASLPADRPPSREEENSWFGFDISHLFGASPAEQTTPQKFGSEQLAQTKAKEETAQAEVDSITAGVTDCAFTPFGKFIVFLDNGQVWRQQEGDADHASFRKRARDNKVTISRGLLGSYNLTINDSNKVFKVVRVK